MAVNKEVDIIKMNTPLLDLDATDILPEMIVRDHDGCNDECVRATGGIIGRADDDDADNNNNAAAAAAETTQSSGRTNAENNKGAGNNNPSREGSKNDIAEIIIETRKKQERNENDNDNKKNSAAAAAASSSPNNNWHCETTETDAAEADEEETILRGNKSEEDDNGEAVAALAVAVAETLTDLGNGNGHANRREEAQDSMGATIMSASKPAFRSRQEVSSREQHHEHAEQGMPLPTETTTLPTTTLPPTTTTLPSASSSAIPTMIERKGQLSPLHVGRIIGKGGEMIRDLQARSGCHIDVNQNVPPNAPRIVVYRGERAEDVEFARGLVELLCGAERRRDEGRVGAAEGEPGEGGGGSFAAEGGDAGGRGHLHVELPLGKATQKRIRVPKAFVGRIIGRGGEMIRELQSKSHARIQVDHAGDIIIMESSRGGSNNDAEVTTRAVTITGTKASVERAEDMIAYLMENSSSASASARGSADGSGGVVMSGREQQQQQNSWSWDGSDGPSSSSSQQGQQQQQLGMQHPTLDPYWIGGYHPHVGQQQPAAHAAGMGYPPHTSTYAQHPQAQWTPNRQTTPAELPIIETDSIPCAKKDVGHIIGRKGATINDLQRRSSCDIQIDQTNYQIGITGPRAGIEMAKAMVARIVERGSGHPYVGGRHRGAEPGAAESSYAESYARSVPQSRHGYSDGRQQQQAGYHASNHGYANQQQQQHYDGIMPEDQSNARSSYYGAEQHQHPMMMYQQQHPAQNPYQLVPEQQLHDPYLSQHPHSHTEELPELHQHYSTAAAAGTALAQTAASASSWAAATTLDGRVYYFDRDTMETRWDKPAEMQ